MNELLNSVWSEKYRPVVIDDLITTKQVKDFFKGMLDRREVPNLLLVGPPGCGKTTGLYILMDTLGYEYITINGSLDGNIDTLRNKIQQFASTISFTGGRKYVILDEADGLSQQTQKALRGFIQTFAANCGFIATANYENAIIEPLRERFTLERFTFTRDQTPRLAMAFTKRLQAICTAEGVTANADVLAQFVIVHTPNWRKAINLIQKYAISNNMTIDTGILSAHTKTNISALIKPLFKDNDFKGVRKWVANAIDNDVTGVYTDLAEHLPELVVDQHVGDLIVILAKYQYQAAFVADQQINLSACLAEIMVSCSAK